MPSRNVYAFDLGFAARIFKSSSRLLAIKMYTNFRSFDCIRFYIRIARGRIKPKKDDLILKKTLRY